MSTSDSIDSPSWARASFASLVGAKSFTSSVLMPVPASSPLMPYLARTASPCDSPNRDWFVPLATLATRANDSIMDAIEVSLESAAAESVSAACWALRPNTFIATFMNSAAWAASTPETWANSTAARPAPANASSTPMPALMSSVKAWAIFVGAIPIDFDSRSDSSRTAAICSGVMSDTAPFNSNSASWNVAVL